MLLCGTAFLFNNNNNLLIVSVSLEVWLRILHVLRGKETCGTMAHSVLFLLLLSFLARGLTYTPTEEDFDLHNRFVGALNNNSFALFTLRELFFPSVGPSPLCAPIIYEITCDDYSTRNFSYLWTQYDSHSLVGQILISSAYYGIVLRGFNWEDSCWFFNDSAFLRLNMDEFNCESDAVFTQLKIFTATVSVCQKLLRLAS